MIEMQDEKELLICPNCKTQTVKYIITEPLRISGIVKDVDYYTCQECYRHFMLNIYGKLINAVWL